MSKGAAYEGSTIRTHGREPEQTQVHADQVAFALGGTGSTVFCLLGKWVLVEITLMLCTLFASGPNIGSEISVSAYSRLVRDAKKRLTDECRD